MRFGQAAGELLRAHGVDTVFGIPGVHTLELFRDVEDLGIRPVIPRHEQGAGFMADGYARASGKPGVCFLVTGPGVLNAMTPIAQAWHDSIPMLVIASTLPDPASRVRSGALHETPDLRPTLAPYTRISTNVETIGELAEALREAFDSWRHEAPKPVFIGIPIDLLGRAVAEEDLARAVRATALHDEPRSADPESLADLAAMLSAAERPAFLVGGGARGGATAIAELAELLQAPIALTGNAKGLLPDSHPLNLGTSLRSRTTRELLRDADLVVALGAQLSPIEYTLEAGEAWDLGRVVRVDLDPEAAPIGATVRLARLDTGAFAEEMLARLRPALPHRASRLAECQAARAAWHAARDAEPLAEWIEAIEQALPERANIAVDSAHLAYQSHMHLRVGPTGRWMAPYGLGTLGPALPMAIGAKVADPGAAALAIAGDGGSLFTISELATARDLGLQLSYVIWDNRGYHEIRRSFERAGIRPVGVDTSAEDLAAIARGFGAEVQEVAEPAELRRALEAALRSPRLSVVVVRADRIGARAQ